MDALKSVSSDYNLKSEMYVQHSNYQIFVIFSVPLSRMNLSAASRGEFPPKRGKKLQLINGRLPQTQVVGCRQIIPILTNTCMEMRYVFGILFAAL
jgi:hypothetical protein